MVEPGDLTTSNVYLTRVALINRYARMLKQRILSCFQITLCGHRREEKKEHFFKTFNTDKNLLT